MAAMAPLDSPRRFAYSQPCHDDLHRLRLAVPLAFRSESLEAAVPALLRNHHIQDQLLFGTIPLALVIFAGPPPAFGWQSARHEFG